MTDLLLAGGPNAKLKKADVVEAARHALKREISNSEYTKVSDVGQLCHIGTYQLRFVIWYSNDLIFYYYYIFLVGGGKRGLGVERVDHKGFTFM